jgi:hypothetical protein
VGAQVPEERVELVVGQATLLQHVVAQPAVVGDEDGEDPSVEALLRRHPLDDPRDQVVELVLPPLEERSDLPPQPVVLAGQDEDPVDEAVLLLGVGEVGGR